MVLLSGAAALFTACTTGKGGSTKYAGLKPGESLGIASVPNLRDVGGYTTADGKTVARGIAYRSNQLYAITPDDRRKIQQLGWKNDYDLRTDAEVKAKPDELPPGVNYVQLNVLADAKSAAPAKLEALLHDPMKANDVLGNGKIEQMFIKGYREFVSLPSARESFRKLFADLADPSRTPAVFHCTTGKDRTGWAAAAMLTLMGVPKETVYADFLKSNDYILPMYQPVINEFTEAGGDNDIPIAIFGVNKDYLDASFDEMQTKYGGIVEYFEKAFGMDAAEQKALKDRFLSD